VDACTPPMHPTPYSYLKKKYINIYIYKLPHALQPCTPISSHGPEYPHRGHLPTGVWGCVAGRGPPRPTLGSITVAQLLAAVRSSGSGPRIARAPPPVPGASGRGETSPPRPVLGTAWPEPLAALLPSCCFWMVSLALEVSPLGFYPGEVEGGGGDAGLRRGRGVSSKK